MICVEDNYGQYKKYFLYILKCFYKNEECEPAYHFVFLIFHLLKHFELSGCGIRMFLDLPFFIEGNSIDFKTLESYLKQLKLKGFTDSVLRFCLYAFDYKAPYDISGSISDNVFDLFKNKILDGGTFGSTKAVSMEQILERGDISVKSSGKLKSAFRIVFPSREYMHDSGIWDKKIPLVFLPAGYIKRLYVQLFKKKNGGKFIKGYKNYMKENLNKKMYYELGIKRGCRKIYSLCFNLS